MIDILLYILLYFIAEAGVSIFLCVVKL